MWFFSANCRLPCAAACSVFACLVLGCGRSETTLGMDRSDADTGAPGLVFVVDDITIGAAIRGISGCLEVLESAPATREPGKSTSGANPTEGKKDALRLEHVPEARGIMARVFGGDQQLATRSFSFEFVKSGAKDVFELPLADKTFRISHWGVSSCSAFKEPGAAP